MKVVNQSGINESLVLEACRVNLDLIVGLLEILKKSPFQVFSP